MTAAASDSIWEVAWRNAEAMTAAGQEPRRHHLLPRFYLQRWAVEDRVRVIDLERDRNAYSGFNGGPCRDRTDDIHGESRAVGGAPLARHADDARTGGGIVSTRRIVNARVQRLCDTFPHMRPLRCTGRIEPGTRYERIVAFPAELTSGRILVRNLCAECAGLTARGRQALAELDAEGAS